MTIVTTPVVSWEIAVVVNQVKSKSGVIGKQLVNENGHNRFALIMEYPDGTRGGYIYRVQPHWEADHLLYRDHKTDFDPTDPAYAEVVKGIPTYKWEDLGSDFWLERF